MTDEERIAVLERRVSALLDVIAAQQRALESMRPRGRARGRVTLKPEDVLARRAVLERQLPVEDTELEEVPLAYRGPLVRRKSPEEQAEAERVEVERVRAAQARAEEERQRAARRWVYFVQRGDDGPVKIGITKDIKSRMSSLQTGHAEQLRLLASFEGARRDERELHDRLSAHRISGEWFHPAPEVLAAAAEKSLTKGA